MPTFQVELGYDSNVLDLVISECENRVFQINHHHPLGSIDHSPLIGNYYTIKVIMKN